MAFDPNGQHAHIIVLLDIEIGRRLDLETWTQAEHPNLSVWYIAHAEGEPSKVEQNGVEMTAAGSIAEVEATESSWYFDASTARLYIHVTGDGEPVDGSPYLQSYHWSRHANEVFEFMGHSYRPDLDVSAMPDVSAETGEYHEGNTAQSFGSIVLLNGDGFYDALFDTYIWEARRFIIRVGERDKGDANFEIVVDGWTGSIDWTDERIDIGTEDLQTNLL